MIAKKVGSVQSLENAGSTTKMARSTGKNCGQVHTAKSWVRSITWKKVAPHVESLVKSITGVHHINKYETGWGR